jgi:hypothetical protein
MSKPTKHSYYYSDNYFEARKKFLLSCELSKWDTNPIPTDEHNQYFIDFSHYNIEKSDSCLILISGTHGVEGYLGSAIQLAILDSIKENSLQYKENNIGLVLVHALNPYGMEHNRQLTKENINLNRNFIIAPEIHQGVSEKYRICDYLLNPQSIEKGDYYYFHYELLKLIYKYGFKSLKSALASGQYEYPKGLFFGGKELVIEAKILINWLSANLKNKSNIACIDIHSGLGKWGFDSLLGGVSPKADLSFCKAFKNRTVELDPNNSVAYKTNGGLIEALPSLFKDSNVYGLVQEFGTYNILKVLYNIRLENYYYNNSSSNILKPNYDLKEIFCPSDPKWRSIVIQRGLDVFNQTYKFLNELKIK